MQPGCFQVSSLSWMKSLILGNISFIARVNAFNQPSTVQLLQATEAVLTAEGYLGLVASSEIDLKVTG